MKKPLLVISIFFAILVFTNPGLPVHRAAILEDTQGRFMEGKGAQIAGTLGAGAIANEVEATVNQRVSRANYWLFSLTRINYVDVADPGTGDVLKRDVGIGVLGQVFLWSGM